MRDGQGNVTERQSLILLISVCAVTFLARLAFVSYIFTHYNVTKIYGGFESARVAAALAGGHGFSSLYGIPSGPTAWLPPTYPLIVAAAFKLFGTYSAGSVLCLYVVNLVCATITTALLFRIGLLVCSPFVAFAGSMLWAVEFDAIVCSARIWESSLSAMLATIAIFWYLHLADSPPKRRDWIAYGLSWGLAALTNTALLAMMPLAVIALLCRWGRQVRGHALVALLVFGCVLLPWSVRNYAAFHKVIPIRGNFGPNLWYGNHPGVTGPDDETLDPTQNDEELQAYLTMGDAAYCLSRQRMAYNFIRQNPGEFLRLTRDRVLFYWVPSTKGAWVLRVCWSLLSFVGLLILTREKGVLVTAPFISALLLYPLPYYVTHAEGFYRHPIEPAMALLVAYCCVQVVEAARGLLFAPKASG